MEEAAIKIKEIEVLIIYLRQLKVNYIARQCYKTAYMLRYEENKLLQELEELTSNEYLKTQWNVSEIERNMLPPRE